MALEWRNLTYTVPVGKGKKKGTKMILDRLTGVAPPGHLLAIMGPTGAPLPPCTLLWVLVGHVTGFQSCCGTSERSIRRPTCMPASD